MAKGKNNKSNEPKRFLACVHRDADGDLVVEHVWENPKSPVFNISFRNPETKESARAGTVFTNEWGSFNLAPKYEDAETAYGREVPLATAAVLSNKKQGFINMYMILPKTE